VTVNFTDLYKKPKNMSESSILLTRWIKDTKYKAMAEVDTVADMFYRHFDGVSRTLMSVSSNAFAERINGCIKQIQLKGRGYRLFESFRSALLFFYGNLDLYPLE
jgi:transposase